MVIKQIGLQPITGLVTADSKPATITENSSSSERNVVPSDKSVSPNTSSPEQNAGENATKQTDNTTKQVEVLREQRRMQQVIRQLASRDREVRAHEQAHANVGGQYAGAPKYNFTKGPDGKQYAVSGEVKIDVSPVPDDPQATIEKARIVKRAALAPKEPSEQDKQVAQKAQQMALEAQIELMRKQETDAAAFTNVSSVSSTD